MTRETVFEPDVIVSEKALARRKRFTATKEAAGLPDQVSTLSKPLRIYFDSQYQIVCATRDPDFPVDPSWQTYDFSFTEISQLTAKSFSEFIVVKNEHQDQDYSIVSTKKLNRSDVGVRHETSFQEVGHILKWDTELTQCEFNVTKDSVTIQITDAGLEFLDTYKGSDYQIRNQKVMSVYITLKKNPHYLIYDFKVPIKDFLSGEPIVHEFSKDYSSYSIYTKPLFQYCYRT